MSGDVRTARTDQQVRELVSANPYSSTLELRAKARAAGLSEHLVEPALARLKARGEIRHWGSGHVDGRVKPDGGRWEASDAAAVLRRRADESRALAADLVRSAAASVAELTSALEEQESSGVVSDVATAPPLAVVAGASAPVDVASGVPGASTSPAGVARPEGSAGVVWDWIAAHPGCDTTQIAAGVGMLRPTVYAILAKEPFLACRTRRLGVRGRQWLYSVRQVLEDEDEDEDEGQAEDACPMCGVGMAMGCACDDRDQEEEEELGDGMHPTRDLPSAELTPRERLWWSEASLLRQRLAELDGEACIVCGCTEHQPCEHGCWWSDIPELRDDLATLLQDGPMCSTCARALSAADDQVAAVLQIREALYVEGPPAPAIDRPRIECLVDEEAVLVERERQLSDRLAETRHRLRVVNAGVRAELVRALGGRA